MGLNLGLTNSINAQRGEHSHYTTALLPKLIHNKTELFHSFIANLDRLLSPSAIFAAGFWHHLSPYYPLGFLFPWDIFLLYFFCRKKTTQLSFSGSHLYFISALLALFLLSGMIYLDQALTYSLALVYFLLIWASHGYSALSLRLKIVLLAVSLLFLIYQSSLITYFRV